MALTQATLNALNPQALALAGAGMAPTLNPEQFKAYNTLWTVLSGEKWDQDTNPVMSVYSGKVYLPKLYQVSGTPQLQWGSKLLPIVASEKLFYTYVTGNTGYSAPHVSLIFTPESSVKGAKESYQVLFPISLVQGDNVPGEFLSQVPVDEEGALSSYVRKPDPTTGLRWLDDAAGPASKEIEVTVLDSVTRIGAEEYGGKPFTTATVKAPSIHPTEVFKVRTNTETNYKLQGPLLFPLNVPGVVRRAKKNLNLQDVTLTPDNIDMGALI
jgi:hypothetical protein